MQTIEVRVNYLHNSDAATHAPDPNAEVTLHIPADLQVLLEVDQVPPDLLVVVGHPPLEKPQSPPHMRHTAINVSSASIKGWRYRPQELDAVVVGYVAVHDTSQWG